jgi:hypothetical protein
MSPCTPIGIHSGNKIIKMAHSDKFLYILYSAGSESE